MASIKSSRLTGVKWCQWQGRATLETRLITEIERTEAVVEIPPAPHQLFVIGWWMSEAGRIVLWLSEKAAKQLAEYLFKFPSDSSA